MIDNNDQGMPRRDALLRLAGLCGLALSGDALAALAAPARQAGLLAPGQLRLTGVLAELIIPKTSTPGALGVGAHRTISLLLRVCAAKATQEQFLAGLERINAVAVATSGKPFTALSNAKQTALLQAIDVGGAPFNSGDQQFFRLLKQYTVFAYYTSEAGATRELAYLPIPGGFTGNFPLSEVGRSWAL